MPAVLAPNKLERGYGVALKNIGAKVVLLQFLPMKRLLLCSPLSLFIEMAADKIIVSNANLDLFGYGETESEAISDFARSFEELYFTLKENAGKLSVNLTFQLKFFATLVSEK